MDRVFRRVLVVAAALSLVPAGPAAAGGQVSGQERDDPNKDDVIVSVDTGPVCWEAPEPTGSCEVTVGVSQALEVPVVISLATEDGTALAQQDYWPLKCHQAEIEPGERTVAVALQIRPDQEPEDAEWFYVSLDKVSVGTIGEKATKVVIQDGAPEDEES